MCSSDLTFITKEIYYRYYRTNYLAYSCCKCRTKYAKLSSKQTDTPDAGFDRFAEAYPGSVGAKGRMQMDFQKNRFWSMRSRQRAFLTILLQNPFSLLMEKKLTNQLSLITRKFPDMESVPWQERRKFMPAI